MKRTVIALAASCLLAPLLSGVVSGAAAPPPRTTSQAKPPAAAVFDIAELRERHRERGSAYLEFLKVADLSAGVYELARGAVDKQSPHGRDEVYYVTAGRAVFAADGKRTQVGPGSVIYVRRGVEHRFEQITEDLSVLVIFAAGRDTRRR